MAELFLPWEKKLYLDYLGLSAVVFVDESATELIKLAVMLKDRITVNQARRILNTQTRAPLHPDPVRGALYIFEDDSAYYKANDALIPMSVTNEFPSIQFDPNDVDPNS